MNQDARDVLTFAKRVVISISDAMSEKSTVVSDSVKVAHSSDLATVDDYRVWLRYELEREIRQDVLMRIWDRVIAATHDEDLSADAAAGPRVLRRLVFEEWSHQRANPEPDPVNEVAKVTVDRATVIARQMEELLRLCDEADSGDARTTL